jgi:hypothetical protein
MHKVSLIVSGIQINTGLEESYRTLQVPPTHLSLHYYYLAFVVLTYC